MPLVLSPKDLSDRFKIGLDSFFQLREKINTLKNLLKDKGLKYHNYDVVLIDQCEFILDKIDKSFVFGMETNRITQKHANLFSDEYFLYINNLNTSLKRRDIDASFMFLKKIFNELQSILSVVIQIGDGQKNEAYNSKEYYNGQIRSLKEEKEKLEDKLKEEKIKLDDQLKKQEKAKKDEIDAKEKIIAETQEILKKTENDLKQYALKLAEKEKQEDLVTEWNLKIKKVFFDLASYLSPIEEEKKRLNVLFFFFAVLLVLSIACLCFFELRIFECVTVAIPDFDIRKCIRFLFPIPILASLIGVFIVQMNRSQRQLVVLAKQIHEIKYIEGLLLSLNSLSLNINESMTRINAAIDQLIKNHLNENRSDINESFLEKEEKKDSIPYETLLKLLSTLKNVKE